MGSIHSHAQSRSLARSLSFSEINASQLRASLNGTIIPDQMSSTESKITTLIENPFLFPFFCFLIRAVSSVFFHVHSSLHKAILQNYIKKSSLRTIFQNKLHSWNKIIFRIMLQRQKSRRTIKEFFCVASLPYYEYIRH